MNVLAASAPFGSQPALTWALERGSLLSAHLLDWLPRLPRVPDKPLVVVLDNGSIHVSRLVKQARAALKQQRSYLYYLYYLPPYSPQLNLIEPVFGGIKAHDLPARAYPTWEALEDAIPSMPASLMPNSASAPDVIPNQGKLLSTTAAVLVVRHCACGSGSAWLAPDGSVASGTSARPSARPARAARPSARPGAEPPPPSAGAGPPPRSPFSGSPALCARRTTR